MSTLWSRRKSKPAAWLAWAAVGLLAGSCAVLAILQYRWITEFSAAERQRLHEQLQSGLNLLSHQFNDDIASASEALVPTDSQIERLGIEEAYASRYTRSPLFRRIALAIPQNGTIELRMLNLETTRFEPAEWPADWAAVHERMELRLKGTPERASFDTGNSTLIEIPHFSNREDQPRIEQEWLIEELNIAYIRDAMLPELMNRFLGDAGKLDYDVSVVAASNPSTVVFGTSSDAPPDGAATLLDLHLPRMGPGPPGGPPHFRPRPDRGRGPGPPPPGFDSGVNNERWRLLVRHHAGSLEALVERARWRNLVASAGLLLLILLTMALLVRFSRQSQRLAEQQMNFVAGVSHELRTPLTVIRTAAFNLRGKLASRPEQVERYGALIQDESEKLTALVEQVLRFASGEAGHAVRDREPVEVAALIDSSLQSSGADGKAVVERHFQSGLPRVLADPLAMKHALQNLVENALKYGGDWIGVFASASEGSTVEIRVADHGPGIPADEQQQIFDPFFRGRRAVSDQVHGTGLGLSLVKNIIEAHGGSIRVHSEATGTEFVVRIPAAPAESIT